MAENKKSFVLYCDLIHTIEKMPNDKAGLLFKHLLRYVNDQNPIIDDLLIEIAFEPIKRQLKRDLESWEESLIKKGDGGALGNLKRWHLDLYNKVISKELSLQKAVEQSKYRIASHSDKTVSHPIASIAVTVTDTVTDTVNVNVKNNINEFFKSLLNGSDLERIAMNNKLTIIEAKEYVELFKPKAELTYQTYAKFVSHFKNWLVLNKQKTGQDRHDFLMNAGKM
jgi:hypothetical protein